MLDTHRYANQTKPFIGVRFVLFGFEPNNQLQVKSKLVNGGGVYADRYGQDCTHVIVDSLFYDDHVCIAACNDSKILVTGLWVDHSFDIGGPVDHTSITESLERNSWRHGFSYVPDWIPTTRSR